MSKKTIKENNGEQLVSIFIPKQNRGDTQRFVSVNGERILVQTGVEVRIPEKFARVINNSDEMQAQAESFIQANIAQ
ncbi:MAG: hypothetical protein BWY46_00737 [Firmicutes bacterium ADurb.Bin300]|jgi:hypothetical protein|nr:MAG: hypothetical protein BWY46_00737 [Firmicutes bacterium ADurb.Bin300]